MSGSRDIAKNTLFLYFRMLLSMSVSLFTSRMVLDILGVADYGIYNVVGGITLMFAFISNSMSGATSRFLTFELGRGDQVQLQRTFSVAITIHLMLAGLVLVLSETVGLWFLTEKMVIEPERMRAAQWVYQLSIVATLISILQVPYNALIIANERMKVYAYMEILNSLLKLLVVLVLIYGGQDKLVMYAVMTIFSSVAGFILYRVYCIRNFKESHYVPSWDRRVVYPMIGYSGWNVYASLAYTGRTQGVNILLNLFFGVTVNAAYGIAFNIHHIAQAFSQNFLSAINPRLVKLYAREEIDQMDHLLINASKLSFLLLFCISFPLILENHFALQLWLKNVPDYAVEFCQLNMISGCISAMFSPVVFVIQAKGQIKWVSIVTGGIFLLSVPVSFGFLKFGFSPMTPFIVNIVLTVCASFLTLWFLKATISRVSVSAYLLRVVFPCYAIVLLTSAIPLYLHHLLDEGWERFIWVGASFVILFFASVYIIALSGAQRTYYKGLVVKKLGSYLKK